MISEQKNKYEEAAKEYAIKEYTEADEPTPEGLKSVRDLCARYFLIGAEHAHPIAHSEGKKEGINETLDQVDVILGPIFEGRYPELHEVIMNELQKLRK